MSERRAGHDSGAAFDGWERRGPVPESHPHATTSWEAGLPALAAEHRGSLVEAEAEAAYRWVASFCADRAVLDVNCGIGHGSRVLAESGATSVTATASAGDAVETARRLHGERVAFVRSEPFALPFAAASFDLVVCLDGLERRAVAEPALPAMRRVLAPGGVIVLSLPIEHERDPIDGRIVGEAVDAGEWQRRLGDEFANVGIFHRRVCLGATVHGPADEGPLDSVRWLGAERDEDRAVLLIASDEALPSPEPTAALIGGRDLRAYRATVAAWEQRARRAEADGAAKHWELVASREAQRRLRKRLWELEHRPLRKLWRLIRGRPATLAEGPQLRPPEREEEPWN